jgi:HEPN domain-containing protein
MNKTNRWELQKIARIRKREAMKLLGNNCYSGTYYLCGYVVECALKACIAKNTKRYDFPDKKIVNKSYTHDLEELIIVAELESEHRNEMNQNANFRRHWGTMKDWDVNSRYKMYSKQDATDMYNALVARYDGVYRWVIKYW